MRVARAMKGRSFFGMLTSWSRVCAVSTIGVRRGREIHEHFVCMRQRKFSQAVRSWESEGDEKGFMNWESGMS